MLVEIENSSLLRLKLSRSDDQRQPVSFLVGAPFSLDGGMGVPNVDGFIEVVRERAAQAGPGFVGELEARLADCAGPQRYQAAMAFLYGAIDARAAADVVEAAVLRARRTGTAPLDPAADFDGDPSDWHVTRAQRALALAMRMDTDRFPGPIFTTNFDPLIELALREQGFAAKATNIPLDGSITSPIKSSRSEVDVFHLHGYWRDSATLHRPEQLMQIRPQLQQSVQRHLDRTHLVVMAYSGWDDIFTTAIANCLSDPGFRGTVSWCFYDSNPDLIRAENAALFKKFAAGISQGKISFFYGVDCHTFFDELMATLGFAPAIQGATDSSPIPGWQLVTREALQRASLLSGPEAVQFFDGAVPTLRHAVSPLIPRLSHTDALVKVLAGAVTDGCGMQLLRAAGGEGKSTALLQAAAQVAVEGQAMVLYRPAPDTGLPAEAIARLDPAKTWLVVADDAEGLIDDLWAAADQLRREGRQNVFFLLATRDSDWRIMGGDAKGWSTRLNKLDDLILGSLKSVDAGLVVDAWAAQGDDGLRDLRHARTREDRATKLVQAAQAQSVVRGEGSFFGGLLDTRFGATGLVEHLLPLLAVLRERPINGGDATLFDALLYVASCHAVGIPGLDNRVLAALCGVSPYGVTSAIVAPLGRELGAAESRGHVLTRHKRVAEAIVIAANRMNADLAEVWRDLVTETVRLGLRHEVSRECHGPIIHAGSRLKRNLPQALDKHLRGDIGIAAGEAAMAAEPKRLSPITDLARALRAADCAKEAFELLQRKLPDLNTAIDRASIIRGYFFEWSIAAGNLGNRRGTAMSVWLAAYSLSDALAAPVNAERAKLSCAGLGVGLGDLLSGGPTDVYARGRRAATTLGLQSNPDPKTARYFAQHRQELDRIRTPQPSDNDEALAWFSEAALAAWQELGDGHHLHSLKKDGRLTFKSLRKLLAA